MVAGNVCAFRIWEGGRGVRVCVMLLMQVSGMWR